MKAIIHFFLLLTFIACNSGGGEQSITSDPLCGSGTTGESCPNDPYADTEKFKVIDTDPLNRTSDFGVDEQITIQFSTQINESSIVYNTGNETLDNLILRSESGEEVHLEISIDDKLLKVKPMFSLSPSTKYSFTLKTDITDMNSQNLVEELNIEFVTIRDSGMNTGSTPVFTMTDRDNPKGSIGYYEFHYGLHPNPDPNNNNFQYSEVPRYYQDSEMASYYDATLDNYQFEFQGQFETGQTYYFAMKACWSNGVCSGWSPEASRDL